MSLDLTPPEPVFGPLVLTLILSFALLYIRRPHLLLSGFSISTYTFQNGKSFLARSQYDGPNLSRVFVCFNTYSKYAVNKVLFFAL